MKKTLGRLANFSPKLKSKGFRYDRYLTQSLNGVEGGIETTTRQMQPTVHLEKHRQDKNKQEPVPAEELQNWLRSMKMSTINVQLA